MKIITLPVGFIPTNSYILCDEKTGKAAVIDPGFEAPRILSELRKTGCRAEYVLLTHGHFDHATDVSEIQKATGAKLAACDKEAGLLASPSLSLYDNYYMYFKKPFVPLYPDYLLKDGGKLQLGSLELTFLHTPGHTEGSCCIVCEDVIFTGDTVFKEDIGRTDLPTADRAAIRNSVKRIAGLAGDYKLYPGHGCFTTLSYERSNNVYMR